MKRKKIRGNKRKTTVIWILNWLYLEHFDYVNNVFNANKIQRENLIENDGCFFHNERPNLVGVHAQFPYRVTALTQNLSEKIWDAKFPA